MGRVIQEFLPSNIEEGLNLKCRNCGNVLSNWMYAHMLKSFKYLYVASHVVNVIREDEMIHCRRCNNNVGTYNDKLKMYVISKSDVN